MPKFQQPHTVPYGQWVKVIDAGVPEFALQVKKGELQLLRHGDEEPTEKNRGWLWQRGEGERGLTLDDISKGPGDCLWAFGVSFPAAEIEVDHA